MAIPTVGMIGLGLMGSGLAQRLLATGHKVIAYDIAADKLAAAVERGALAATSPKDVAERADVVLVCVMSTADVSAVIEGPDGIVAAGRIDGTVVVDHSTTEIPATQRLAGVLAERTGATLVDAPVSGGPAAAQTGRLAIMAGGPDDAIATVRPVMEMLGTFTHMGGVGTGQATKLVNQTLVLTNFCVIAEALRLAEAYGVDAKKVPQALAAGHAGSNLLPVLFERMIARDWTPTGYARQVLKDLEMLSAAAKEKGLATPMTSEALTLFRMLVGQGRGGVDGAAVLELLPDRTTKRGGEGTPS